MDGLTHDDDWSLVVLARHNAAHHCGSLQGAQQGLERMCCTMSPSSITRSWTCTLVMHPTLQCHDRFRSEPAVHRPNWISMMPEESLKGLGGPATEASVNGPWLHSFVGEVALQSQNDVVSPRSQSS